jgi:hypothetical protein
MPVPDTVPQRKVLVLRQHHWSILIATMLVILFAFLLETRPDHRVQLRWGPTIPVPETCGSKIWFGLECPFCGLTRSFIALSRGDLSQAWHLNRISSLVAVFVLAQLPYRLWWLAQLRHGAIPRITWPKWCAGGLLVLLMVNWILKQCGI